MKAACTSLLLTMLTSAFAAAPTAQLARAESDSTVDLQSEIVVEVEGKDASLALLEFIMKNHAAQSCGAKRAKMVLSETSEHSAQLVATDQRPVPESDVLELAMASPENENLLVMYHCEFAKESFRGKAVSVTHAAYENKVGWTASIMRLRTSLAPKEAPSVGVTEVEVAYALAEASRQINAVSPVVMGDGARLDSTSVSENTLVFNFTLLDRNASEVKGKKLRRAVKPKIQSAVCSDEKHLAVFRGGGRYEYRYRGKDGQEVTTITVGPKDCE